MTRSGGAAARCARRVAAVRRLDDLVALGAEAGAQQPADRRLVVDDEDADGAGASCRGVLGAAVGRGRQGDGEDGARSGRPGCRRRSCRPWPRRSRGRSRGRGRCRPAPGRPSARGGTCRRCARGRPAGCPRPRRAPASDDAAAGIAPALRRGRSVPAGAYFAALSSRLNSTCSNSTGSTSTIGRSAARSTSTRWPASTWPARCRALPTISPRSCGGAVRRDRARTRAGSCRAGWR